MNPKEKMNPAAARPGGDQCFRHTPHPTPHTPHPPPPRTEAPEARRRSGRVCRRGRVGLGALPGIPPGGNGHHPPDCSVFLARDATGARKNRTLFGVQLGNSSEISTSRGRVPRRLPGYRCGFAAGLDKSNASSSASNPDLVADSQRGRGNSSLTHTDSGGSATPIRPLTGFRAARLFGFFWRALQG